MIDISSPFSIGNVKISSRVVLAPLAGYTDVAFRMICRKFGAPYTATEMMLDRLVLHPSRQTSPMLVMDDRDHPIAGQIVGNEPETMAMSARQLERMGFDVIDLNFACPVRKALSRRRGGFIMSQPKLAIEIARAVVLAVDVPVTLKLRRKFKQDDTEDNFFQIASGAFNAGAAAICVHARSVEAKYTGPADWSFLARVKEQFPDRTIVGSGDLKKPEDVIEMLDQTGLDAALAARGALGNPWFFKHVLELSTGKIPTPPSIAEQKKILREHYDAAKKIYGTKTPKVMRAHGVKYASISPHPKKNRIAFVNAKTDEQWYDVIEKYDA